MFTVRKHRLSEGLNHISMPRYAEPLCVDALPNGLHLWYRGPHIVTTLSNRIFMVVDDGQAVEEAAYNVRYIGSITATHIRAHVFELVPIERESRIEVTGYGEQLVGEGR
jgi:hypothetical protein